MAAPHQGIGVDVPGLDDDFGWLLLRQDGVITSAQALEGIGRAALRRHLGHGRWRGLGRSVIVTHNGPLTERQRVWAALLTAGPGALCAGRTAAALEGVRGYESEVIHLIVTGQPRPIPGARLHRTTVLPQWHTSRTATPPRTTIARSIVDAAAWAPNDDDARAIVAAAFQQRRVDADEMSAVLAELPRSRRRSLVRETALLADRGAVSLPELDLVRLCRRFGLPMPEHQVRRTDRDGRVRFLDAYWPDFGLHVEVDGAWHMEVCTWWADMHRQNQVWVKGECVLRFPAWAIRHEAALVAEQIATAMGLPTVVGGRAGLAKEGSDGREGKAERGRWRDPETESDRGRGCQGWGSRAGRRRR